MPRQNELCRNADGMAAVITAMTEYCDFQILTMPVRTLYTDAVPLPFRPRFGGWKTLTNRLKGLYITFPY